MRALPQQIGVFTRTPARSVGISVASMHGPRLRLAPALPSALSVELPIRIVLADDHALMRRSLRLLLDGEDDMEVSAVAENMTAVSRYVERHQPHVLVLDLSMPTGSSLEAIRRLRERVPDTQIVVMTMQDNPAFAQPAFAAGALGFVAKDRADEELPEAVRGAARGEEFVSPQIAARLDALRGSLNDDAMTPREVEVLRLIALGHTSVEVARKLHLSPRTVETHRAHIFTKLGLTTRAELVRHALRRGLLGA